MINQIILLIIKAIIIGASWTVFYYYVRRKFNPGSVGEGVKANTEKKLSGEADLTVWWGDAYWGGIAAGLMFLFNYFVTKWLDVSYEYISENISLISIF